MGKSFQKIRGIYLKMANLEEIKKSNIKIFDKMSPVYARIRQQDYSREYSQLLINKYKKVIGYNFLPVDNFLDVGCGLGFLSVNFSLSGLVKHPYGFDISIGMLKECKKKAREFNLDVYLVQADIEYIPYKNEKFDLIMGHGILHHLPSAEASLQEVYRLLKKDGLCVFTEPNKIGNRIISLFRWLIWSILYLIRQISKTDEERMIDVTTFRPKDLEQIARKIGFSSVSTKPFAGFLSRILYWILDPINQRISNKYFLLIVNKIIGALYILDIKILQYLVPKEWFDEFAIVLRKK